MSRPVALGELFSLLAVLEWVLWTESKHVMPQPYRTIGSTVMVLVILGLLYRQWPSLRVLGLSPDSWLAGLGSLVKISTVGISILIALGWSLGSLGQSEKFWYWIVRNWHLEVGQQLLLQVLLVPRLVALFRTDGFRISVIAAVVFSLLHAPNLPLMILTLPVAVAWCEWFRRYRNFPILWASHLLLAGTALYCLAPLLGKLRVGAGYLFL